MWEHLAIVYQRFESLGKAPIVWTCFRQAHIPKPQGDNDHNSARKASHMRPICVGSVWYRVWASARLRTPQAQLWQANVPDYFVGGRKGCDVLSSVLSIVEAAEQGAFVGSLDFTKAFDMVRPEYAEEMLRYHGCPGTVVSLLGSLWGAQQRYLTFDGVVHPVPVWAGSSLPQGDPWSVRPPRLALFLCMTLLAKAGRPN